ncbi:MAG: hypothetical protein V5A66_01895 [Candidatus Thermoplasmatota archaeon]
MKLSDVKSLIIKIFTNRDVQLTIALFGIGFLLTVASTYPTLEERVEEDTLTAEDNKRIEANLPFPNDKSASEDPILEEWGSQGIGGTQGLKNASLELSSDRGETNANITLLKDREAKVEGVPLEEIKSWEMKKGKNFTINMTKYHQTDYIDFNVTKGELNYTYTVRYYTQSYSFLSIPGYVMMIVSIIFLLRAFYTVGPIGIDKEEKEKKKENQKVITQMLEDRKEK